MKFEIAEGNRTMTVSAPRNTRWFSAMYQTARATRHSRLASFVFAIINILV